MVEENLKNRTAAQRKKDVEFFAKMPLKELRRRQNLVHSQQGAAFKQYESAIARNDSVALKRAERAGDNLLQMERDLAEAIGMKCSKPYTPPDNRKFGGETYSLAWVTGFENKSKVELIKKMIKTEGSKPYKVRLVQNDGAYWVYTKPRLAREDSSKVVNRYG